MRFINISPFEVTYNFFNGLHKDWCLLCAGNSNNIKECNMMTISWGGVGILWNKPIAICYVRPQRYTFKFIEENKSFSLNFFESKNKNYKKALDFCGANSGRDFNKFIETGLTLYKTKNNIPSILQSKLIIECKSLYSDFIKEDLFLEPKLVENFYQKKDFHKFFIGEIVNILQATE